LYESPLAANTKREVIIMYKNKKSEVEKVKIYRISNLAQTMQNENKGSIPSDVLGSYTGITTDNTRPEQDADDL
jgi:hypothetical protein